MTEEWLWHRDGNLLCTIPQGDAQCPQLSDVLNGETGTMGIHNTEAIYPGTSTV